MEGLPVMWHAGDGVTLVAGDRAVDGFRIAAAMLLERLQSGIEVETLTPHRLVDGAWVPSVWPEEVQDTLRLVERLFAQQWYERQRGPLGDYCQQQGIDVSVPEYRVMETPEGETISACAYVEGTQTLIPDVDLVLVIRPDGSAQPHSFDEFRTSAGVSLQNARVSPQRWFRGV
ncbi:hypothetical protein G7067_09655 [Leucobacter insecticola]|uniref:Uncharacterized protein n=1 Tax=Leucobacter insecticola TaxID=2714934 RepID=A0A6G8FJT2_9MICO|nr:hypothetical protein [Leucobacter insecticola]QIM16611.1 hypothetical protein G7067_09655 [Leucobacter insecticola]